MMDVQSVKSDIKLKSVKSFYIFTGDEWAVQRIYIDQIAKIKDTEPKYIDSIMDVYVELRNKSLFESDSCYVVRDDKAIISDEKMQDKIDSGLLGNNVLVLLLNTVDKRTKFYNRYKDTIVIFDPLNAPILAKYIKREIDLSEASINRLMEICEFDYGRCLLEIDKIRRFGKDTFPEVGGDGYDADEAFKVLLDDGTIYQPPKDAIFDFAAAVLSRKTNLAFSLYRECLEIGEAILVMITVLYNNFKAVFQVQTCHSSDIVESTGLTAWQIKNAKVHVGRYKADRILDILCILQNVESGIKRGTIEEQFAMDYILTEVLS